MTHEQLNKPFALDTRTIKIHEAWEIEYWCEELQVTKDQLLAAIKMAGVSVAAVRNYLGK